MEKYFFRRIGQRINEDYFKKKNSDDKFKFSGIFSMASKFLFFVNLEENRYY